MDDQIEYQTNTPVDITADIVAAYVSRNHVQAAELPALITSVYATLSDLRTGASAEPTGPEKATAAQIRKSITPDALISFEDGKNYKTLKRHLTLRGLSAEAYREKWGLPVDYPMTAASYSAQRSELARAIGLGQQRRKPALKVVPADAQAPEPNQAEEAPKTASKARGRKKATETA